jgi:hypothetical protein
MIENENYSEKLQNEIQELKVNIKAVDMSRKNTIRSILVNNN